MIFFTRVHIICSRFLFFLSFIMTLVIEFPVNICCIYIIVYNICIYIITYIRKRGGRKKDRREERKWRRRRSITRERESQLVRIIVVKNQDRRNIERNFLRGSHVSIGCLRNRNQASPSFSDIHALATDGHGVRWIKMHS